MPKYGQIYKPWWGLEHAQIWTDLQALVGSRIFPNMDICKPWWGLEHAQIWTDLQTLVGSRICQNMDIYKPWWGLEYAQIRISRICPNMDRSTNLGGVEDLEHESFARVHLNEYRSIP